MKNRNVLLVIFIASLILLSCSKKDDEKTLPTNKDPLVEIRNFNMIYVEGGEFIIDLFDNLMLHIVNATNQSYPQAEFSSFVAVS